MSADLDSANAVRLGMTLESVDALIGSEPSTSSQSEILGTTVAIRMWQDGLDTISVSFTNDVVTGARGVVVVGLSTEADSARPGSPTIRTDPGLTTSRLTTSRSSAPRTLDHHPPCP